MSGLQLLARVTHCSRWTTFQKVMTSFSTSSWNYDDGHLWGKMARGQELQSNVKQQKVHQLMLDEERDEAMRKIKQLKEVIRESELKLTGLQRMKYMEEENEKKDTVMEQLRAMRRNYPEVNIEIEPVVRHTVREIKNDRRYRFAQSLANLFTAFSLCVICYGLYSTLDRKVAERRAQREGNDDTDGGKEKSAVTESSSTVSSNKSEDTSSIFD